MSQMGLQCALVRISSAAFVQMKGSHRSFHALMKVVMALMSSEVPVTSELLALVEPGKPGGLGAFLSPSHVPAAFLRPDTGGAH